MDLTSYEELILQREKLLEEKEENENRIKEIDSKIRYYEWCVSNCLWLINLNKDNIKTYQKLQKYSKRNKSLFNIFDVSGYYDTYYESRILDFKIENKKLEKDADGISKIIGEYLNYKQSLENKNETIDAVINRINGIVEEKHEKVLTKGDARK